MEYEIGETLLWWPGETDYPSVVVVVDYADNLVNGYLVQRYLVKYRDFDDTMWLVDAVNLSRPKKDSAYIE